jgi:hypothetical protein
MVAATSAAAAAPCGPAQGAGAMMHKTQVLAPGPRSRRAGAGGERPRFAAVSKLTSSTSRMRCCPSQGVITAVAAAPRGPGASYRRGAAWATAASWATMPRAPMARRLRFDLVSLRC